jgi:hypothetical protein
MKYLNFLNLKEVENIPALFSKSALKLSKQLPEKISTYPMFVLSASVTLFTNPNIYKRSKSTFITLSVSQFTLIHIKNIKQGPSEFRVTFLLVFIKAWPLIPVTMMLALCRVS